MASQTPDPWSRPVAWQETAVQHLEQYYRDTGRTNHRVLCQQGRFNIYDVDGVHVGIVREIGVTPEGTYFPDQEEWHEKNMSSPISTHTTPTSIPQPSVPEATFARVLTPRKPLPTITGNYSSSKEIGEKPSFFDGTYTKFNSWLDTLILYVQANKKILPTQEDKIFFTLTCLRNEKHEECTAQLWAKTWRQAHIDISGNLLEKPGTFPARVTNFSDLVQDLQDQFSDPQLLNKAIARLSTYRQSINQECRDFFQKYEVFRTQAGYQSQAHDGWIIQRLEGLVLSKIMNKYYDANVAPATYVDFKAKILLIEENLKKQESRQRGGSFMPTNHSQSSNTRSIPTVSGSSPPAGITKGAGEPMDLSAGRTQRDMSKERCHKCGEFGHWSKHCKNPAKKFFSRRVFEELDISQMTDEDKKAVAARLGFS